MDCSSFYLVMICVEIASFENIVKFLQRSNLEVIAEEGSAEGANDANQDEG